MLVRVWSIRGYPLSTSTSFCPLGNPSHPHRSLYTVKPTPACELCDLGGYFTSLSLPPHLLGTGGLRGMPDTSGCLDSMPFEGSYSSSFPGPRTDSCPQTSLF